MCYLCHYRSEKLCHCNCERKWIYADSCTHCGHDIDVPDFDDGGDDGY